MNNAHLPEARDGASGIPSVVSLFATPAALPIVVAQNLTLAYGGRQILRDVSLRIMPGETWFVIGPNGAGKSTLLKALLGLLPPWSGDLALARELDDRSRVGFVPQRLDLAASVPTTVREFVALGFTGTGCGRAEQQRRLADALAQVSLTPQARTPLDHLSGGQRQRAAIARALVRKPVVLVVDEPTTGLDLVAARDLMDVMTTLTRDHALTTIFVAHDLELVAKHASHVALVAGGTVSTGLARDLLTPTRLSAAFGVPIALDVRTSAAGATP